MRSVGAGAGIVFFLFLLLLASLIGCVSMPPPAAPPAPPLVSPGAPTASAPETAVEWNARAGTIRCRSTTIAVPAELREQVRWTNVDELAIVAAGAPAGGALVVGLIEPKDDGDDDALDFLQDAALTWIRLQLLAGGGLLGTVDMRLSGNSDRADSRLAAEYALGDRKGKAVYLQTERCRIAALDFPWPTDHPPLTNLLAKLEAKIRAAAPETSFERRTRARFDARLRSGGAD